MRNKHCVIPLLVLLFSFSKAFSQDTISAPDYSDSTITIAASDKYHAQLFGKIILGTRYRKVWAAPITVKYLDLRHLKGGLTPLKMGGGLQTKSLRFLGADSNEYVIRTIDKDPSKTVSAIFRNTIVTDLIQDQISASHPYSFLVIPDLSRAANIYHTNPQLFYVPDDPRLGKFRNDFKNRMVLFEERKLTNANVEEGLTGFTKVKDTWEVYDAIHKNSDSYVDEKFLLRSRLFDMMIGDWDRHEDQWLWAQFKPTDSTKMFRPIPRDRDQAFFDFDGFLPTIASLNIAATKKMQRFRPMPWNVKWFNYNARYVDHNLLSQMTHGDWRDMSDSLLLIVSDEEIEKAFRVLPDTVYKLSAPAIIRTLKSRRNNLPLIADKFYDFLAMNVTITGTNKQDYFEVKRSAPNLTEISVYEYKNGVKGKLFYHRIFTVTETKQIQLYGLKSNDVFRLDGKSPSGTLIRIIGGEGNDTIVDQSRAGGFGKKTRVYDTKEGNFLSLGKEGRNKTSKDTLLNTYSTKTYEYNHNLFYPFFGYSADDGIFIGSGLSRVTFGFKKGPCLKPPCYNTAPYASKQSIGFDVATNTGAFNFFYKGDFVDVIGKLDINIQARVQAPNFRYNFFGFGDTTLQIYPRKYYRLRINQATIFPALEAGNINKIRFLFGPIYTRVKVSSDTLIQDNTVGFHQVFPDLTSADFTSKNFLGANTQFSLDPYVLDTMPRFQIRFLVNIGYLKGIESSTLSFGYVRGSVSFFYNLYSARSRTPFLTFATRFGGGTNIDIGSTDSTHGYEFYQSNIIGGRTNENVRGFLGERYAGRSSFYNNLEVRLKLFHFNAYIFPADFGLIGLLDNGIVWEDNQTSDLIHSGYGGGIWMSPFSLAVISATYTYSNEHSRSPIAPVGLLNVKLGWWF